ncbi:late competence protein ComER [Paenibacillus aurantius]|uniref:Pyrroline-5-carboxylate reductase n=1 Tax=Paenibacillus aurantius TaxID=2918900 RepID=A0AA96LGH8_9BACL|nr:late competence protein ComER [Paenibacillus aurantius]WNQ13416.1 late competence protein ComER [Paenibacillus aurantius]
MKTGFIGTGSMGSILIEAFIQSGALQPEEITASNRNPSKPEKLAERYPGLRAVLTNREVAEACRLLFVCVKPSEFKRVLPEIAPYLDPNHLVVSITSPVLIRHLEDQLPCKVAKIIPSITNYVLSGAALCIYSDRLQPEDKLLLDRLAGCISRPIEVEESFTRVTSDISSCGPAFMAFLLQRFVDAAVEETGIPREEATRLASEMLLGTGMLLTAGGFTPDELQKRVAVPGGITAEGLRLMDREVKDLFNQLIRITHAKYREDVDKVEAAFPNKKT